MSVLLARAWTDWLWRWRVAEPVALPPVLWQSTHEPSCPCVDCLGRL